MALMAAHPLADRDEFKRLTPPCTDLECVDECDHTTAHCGRMDDVATRWNAANAEQECETCKGDPEVCASVPGLRHCEKANREDANG